MRITKFGHCCLLVEVDGVRILTDPGNYNTSPRVEDIDAVLITHEHQDHIHTESLKEIVSMNPQAVIYTHEGVGKILTEEKIPYISVRDGEAFEIKGVLIESAGSEHACIHHELPSVQNTGFFIANRFFYPGDAFYVLNKEVEVLALPVAGPWMKLEEAVEYAKTLKPKVVFPVHDGMLRQEHQLGPTRRIPKTLLEPIGIVYRDMKEGSVEEF